VNSAIVPQSASSASGFWTPEAVAGGLYATKPQKATMAVVANSRPAATMLNLTSFTASSLVRRRGHLSRGGVRDSACDRVYFGVRA
jgi:hypothetical protein